MTGYFTDRELGRKPMVEETVGMVVWQAILSLIETGVDDGSLAYGFPSHCPDGNAIEGTNEQAMWNAIRAEIGDLFGDDVEDRHVANYWVLLRDSLPDTPAILDFVEFTARHVAQPQQRGWHTFFRHYHLTLDRNEGLREFVADINRLFSRNGLAYKLTDNGLIERLLPMPMNELLKSTGFSTGDRDLDQLLDTAIGRFRSPRPEGRQDALEKLWDAFERLKTIEHPSKKCGATILIDRTAHSDTPVFRSAVTEEFRAMTKVGNDLRIRHSEVGRESVGDDGEKDYLFMRLFSLIWLVLRKTDRLSRIRNDDRASGMTTPTIDDEMPF